MTEKIIEEKMNSYHLASYFTNLNWLSEENTTTWTIHENKLFEVALATYNGKVPDFWQKVAAFVGGGKTVNDVMKKYEDLLVSLRKIEEGFVPFPCFWSSNFVPLESEENSENLMTRINHKHWTKEEHQLFVGALEQYKGNWKRMSKHVLKTRTASQIASHAQKYYQRQELDQDKKKRASIHDLRAPQSTEQPFASSASVPTTVPLQPNQLESNHVSSIATQTQPPHISNATPLDQPQPTYDANVFHSPNMLNHEPTYVGLSVAQNPLPNQIPHISKDTHFDQKRHNSDATVNANCPLAPNHDLDNLEFLLLRYLETDQFGTQLDDGDAMITEYSTQPSYEMHLNQH